MPELRRDPVVDRWVIIAPERADRPNALLRDYQLPDDEDGCPFCPGNEFLTPPEIASLREQGRWAWRIVPNRYPALRTEERMSRKGIGLFDKVAGVGAHEVIIETDSHRQPLHELPLPRIAAVLRAVQDRILDLSRDIRLRAITYFKNNGAIAGGSLSHAHSQLLALPIVPAELQRELEGARRHFEARDRCIYCDVLDQEMGDRSRLVLETDLAVVLAPYAARTPFELLVLPRAHRALSNLKTWLQGTHHGVSPKHLQVYLDEFVFRHNRRRTPLAGFQTLLGLGASRGPTTYHAITRNELPNPPGPPPPRQVTSSTRWCDSCEIAKTKTRS